MIDFPLPGSPTKSKTCWTHPTTQTIWLSMSWENEQQWRQHKSRVTNIMPLYWLIHITFSRWWQCFMPQPWVTLPNRKILRNRRAMALPVLPSGVPLRITPSLSADGSLDDFLQLMHLLQSVGELLGTFEETGCFQCLQMIFCSRVGFLYINCCRVLILNKLVVYNHIWVLVVKNNWLYKLVVAFNM